MKYFNIRNMNINIEYDIKFKIEYIYKYI